MSKEAQYLTQALKGDNKIMGDWGELVLEKVLEASGLKEGQEYSKQETHEGVDGDRMRPDIIINLPEGKHVIVDSKMSLKAYELHRRCENEDERAVLLESHLKSVLKHIDDLGGKHYSRLKDVNSPELVFLFVPIEPAYLLAMQTDPELSAKAWRKGVAIVTSTTLLVSLKTVASLWRLEKQNKNALEIANEGAKLYDKFVGFMEDFQKIGKTFETGQAQFSTAMGKLKEGPGNVFRKMELLRELGAAPTKRLPIGITE
jgi:DNA recombination protein RmuC